MDKQLTLDFLDLPKIVNEKEKEKLKKIEKPDVSSLNEEQSYIFNKITNLPINKFSQSLLTGYSGTGKTFLTTKIIEELLFKNKGVNIAITAPTNKAVRVLKNLSSICETHSQVEFNTLHSLLGLKRVITDDGKEVFTKEFGGGSIADFNIVIVDEVSMLDNKIYLQLLEECQIRKIMLIFIGDRGQIPPVNGGESILFNLELDNNFNLTKIIRQASDNPIINIAQKVRNGEELKIETVLDENNNGVIFMKINTELELLEKYFNSENFNKNPNFVKVLAWTNKAVDYYNDKIRQMIYGKNSKMINVGEKMVCNKPIIDSKKRIILNNNDEFEVLSYEIKTDKTALKLSFYEVKVKSNGKPYTIKILAESSQKTYEEELERLKNAAEKASPMLRRNAWVKYFNFKDKFADVKYNYALTVHKSQGSTFDNAIVINCDIRRMPSKVEKDKLLYTAITRAKNKLFIIW